MDFTIHKPTFFKNLKFWSFHIAINAIPSFCLAYLHDWNTTQSLIAMTIGTMLFAFLWTYLVSLKDVNTFCVKPFIQSIINAGVYIRFAATIISTPAIISFIIYLISGEEIMRSFTEFTGFLWLGDFITGMISHKLYKELRGFIPIRGMHNFFPTILITLTQGFLLMAGMLAAGLIIATAKLILANVSNH